MKQNYEKKQNSRLLILAIISVLAIVLVWYVMNRAGEEVVPGVADDPQSAAQNVESADDIETDLEEATTGVRMAAAKVEAQVALAIIQARVEAGETYEDVAVDINTVQTELEEAYANASNQTQADWKEIQIALTNLKEELRVGTGDALEYFAEIALLLEADVRADEETEPAVSEEER